MLVLSLIRFIPSTRIGEVHTDAPEINYDKFMVRRYDHLQVLVNPNLELPGVCLYLRHFHFIIVLRC